LLCIDLQPVFIRAIQDGTTVQRRCAFAIAAAQGLGMPILFTEQVPAKLGGTAPELLALAPSARILPKDTFSALADPSVRAAIAEFAPARLFLCGLETPVCIYQTALAARKDAHPVVILSDAVGARRPGDARVCLDALVHDGVGLLPAETMFYAMLGSVQHPFFKAYTQLVKTHG
jgi:nicotinamidase-related amidase